ncbi:Fucose 4-O-acetylase [Thermomonospora echinospora]|uniref:Fucose 4-O-acetylase n=1 Tax=Thermomonospora echinospora TaxID=1992 RepID=A0A1H5WEE5_9ACTN|nr:acyltransferase family protein [Thermomonospora echinospora]SEF97855.1 Fucose 4-O-acetylase [Thermomonospora echinospora]
MTQILPPRSHRSDGTGGAAASAPQAAPAPAPRKERDPFFDNAKFLAILLVVVGHSIVGLRDVPLAKAAYLAIYMFHMPLFIVVTGYLSRNFTFGSGKARKLIVQLGVPYLVFEFAYSIYDWQVGRNDLEITLLDPYYLTWFLMALFLWRLSTPVWQQIRWPLAIAVGISLLSYMDDLGGDLELHRTLGLLPFYVLGLLLRPEHFEIVKKPAARIFGLVTLGGALAVAFVAAGRMNIDWVYWKHGHDKLGVDNLTGTAMRLAMMLAAVVLIAAFLSLVPRRRTWFTNLGAMTLYAYLLHGFLTRLMKFTSFDDLEFWHTVPGVLTMAAVAVVVGTLLCTPPVVKSMKWLLEPKIGWAFTGLRRPQPARPDRGARR